MTTYSTFDVVVIGAGVFGAWTAWHLAKRKQSVLLVEAHAPAHARASSGGESRIIRMSYGPDEIYTRWSLNSLGQWKELFAATGDNLFHRTGVLWLSSDGDSTLDKSASTLRRCHVRHEILERSDLIRRYPQLNLDGISRALLEPESGVLLARRAVARVAENAIGQGVQLQIAQIERPRGGKMLQTLKSISGECISADHFVFACGSWLGKMFPEILDSRIFPTRQEVFFFGTPPGDERFAPPALPTWLFQEDEYYGMPDIEGRGLKIALDHHGERVDPDTQSRLPTAAEAEVVQKYVASRFPAMRNTPVVETRVCQYENTSNGDFLIDRHPQMENVWFVGGGSGHGFKHGPAVGEYVSRQILDKAAPEPRYSLATKETVQHRAVY